MKKSAALAKPVPREKPAPRSGKYFLRHLHQEIDFYDRKLAYLEKFTEFASPEDRQEAERTLRLKRTPLEKAALELAASGVEYDEKDLPRSFRTMNPVAPESAAKNLVLLKRPKRTAATEVAADL